jgi:hypothetical protein
LEVEFPENQVRIDFDSFVLEVRFGSTWVRLNELGSGANWCIRCVDPTWLDRSPASRLPGWESQTYEVS